VAQANDIRASFADPHSPRRGGTKGNGNGLILLYLPEKAVSVLIFLIDRLAITPRGGVIVRTSKFDS